MKFILAPDSFKGTLSAQQVCAVMRAALLRQYPDAGVFALPMADGGEGTVDAFLLALGEQGIKTETVTCTVQGPFGAPTPATYALFVNPTDGRKTAVLETASCAGLPLARSLGEPDPSRTTTAGVGEQIQDALDRGCRRIIIGLGGSATNDAACGAAAALGVRFYDADGNAFVPTGGTLSRIARVDQTGRDARLSETEILCMCDIDNPLYGERGAAYVFAPQKGADDGMVQDLDRGLRHLAALLANGNEQLPGAGAAGGMGYGLVSFLNATLQSGIETVLDLMGFNELAQGATCVLTGEGRFDSQSVHGKVVNGIGKRAKRFGLPVLVIAGCTKNDVTAQDLADNAIAGVFVINPKERPFEEIKKTAEADLEKTMREVLAFIGANVV